MLKALGISTKKITPFFVAILFFITQVASTAAIALINIPTAEAVSGCVNDTAGANDEPGQKDLTRLCVDETGLPNTMQVIWNWDDLGTSGNNTMDACGLFDDSDADVNTDYSICIITEDTPATIQDVVIYSCGNDANDKCTQTRSVIAGPYDTTCTVNQQATDPFAAGNSSPTDTVATCTFHLADLNVQNLTDLELTDVCSYPSSVPGSDPSDCVIIQTDPVATVEVVKDIVPNTDNGLFNLSINGPGDYDTTATNQGDGGTTGQFPIIVAKAGDTVTVSETAGTGTNLANYTSSVSCVYRGTTTQVTGFTSISSTSASFTAKDGENILCTITNTKAGSITIVKDAVANSLQDFAFTATGTGTSNFILDDDSGVAGADATNSNTKIFNNLGAGTYTFTESAVNGWYLDSIDCPNITETQNLTTRQVSLTITAGQNITCTFQNRQLGQINVTKQTDPNNDPTQFPISASPSSGVVGSANQNITDNQTVSYTVKHGTYAVSENEPAGWNETSNNCTNMVIDGNTPLVNGVPTRSCTITNTKYSSLTIVKDAIPNSAQDFVFSTTGDGLSGFILDDDADVTRENSVTFNDLLPEDYSVTEQTETGWALTGIECTGTGVDYTNNNPTVDLVISAGQNITCTFTNTQLGSISGFKFEDINNNGTYDEGEPKLENWNIFIDANGNNQLDPDELDALTDENGFYQFASLLPDSYSILEVMQSGWTQTVAPPTVELSAGENSTNNNFGNFQSGSISGYKFNDVNGNAQHDQDEPKLSGWTIELYHDNDDADSLLNNLFDTAITNGSGNYSFSDLPADTYQVCEVQQTGWVQTLPASDACYTIEIDESGETNINTNFANQGRASLTIKKNIDSDGDGIVDQTNVASWVYDINGSGDYATGSTQNVPAGTHTISEEQQENYTFVSVSCDTEKQVTQGELFEITVNPGDNITCTFVNSRDAGTIEVIKQVEPSDDDGKFDLLINGNIEANDVGDNGTTGKVIVVTGDHNISEAEGPGTDLDNYSVVITGDCDSEGNVTITKGQNAVCTITNTRLAQIIVEKQTLPDGSKESFSFTASYDQDGFSLSDGQSNNSGNLLPGIYSVEETVPEGWDLTSASCSDRSPIAAIELSAGEVVTCSFTNTQRGSISGTKYEVDANDTSGTEGNELSGWLIELYYDSPQDEDTLLDDLLANEETDANGDYSFENLQPGQYKICEQLKDTYSQIFPTKNQGCYILTLQPGQDRIDKDFGNFKNGSITGYKFNDLNGNGLHDENEPKLSGWEISLYKNQLLQDTATTNADGNFSFNNLAPGTYVVCETEQAGWQQTTPDPETDACYEIEINESGENASAVFGNQGRGSITIKKNVDVNGDGDLDDAEDIKNAIDWQWSLEGTYYSDSGVATGDTKSSIPADTYTVTETQKDDYHFVSVSCYVNRNGQEVTQSESFQITLNAGDNITCTFTNARDTGFIIVEKELEPNDDPGLFDLLVDDYKVFKDASDGDASESYRVTTGSHSVSELASNDETELDSYVSTYVCTDSEGASITMGEGASISEVEVDKNQTVTCTFTNTKRPSITIVKDAIPDDEQDFSFATDLKDGYLVLDDDGDEKNDYKRSQTFLNLNPDENYEVTEDYVDGWELTDLSCEGTQNWWSEGSSVSITPEAGENVICTFENTKLGKIVVEKDAIPNDKQDFEFEITKYNPYNNNYDLYNVLDYEYGSVAEFILDDDNGAEGEDEEHSRKEKTDDLLPGWYEITESEVEGWDLAYIKCDDGQENDIPRLLESDTENGDYQSNSYSKMVYLSPGQKIKCEFVNVKRSTVTIVKDSQPDSTQEFTFEHNISEEKPYDRGGVSEPNGIQSEVHNYEYEGPEDFTLVDDGVTPENAKQEFGNLKVGKWGREFGISEREVDGWLEHDFSCDNEKEEGPRENRLESSESENGHYEKEFDHYFWVKPGEDVTCTFVNQEVVLNLTKSNNRPQPTVTGDTVVYTLVVTVPKEAATIYNTVVTDLPPENFQYQPGSWTANSSERGDLKADGTTTEPTYASPGDWNLGEVIGGETITLTYVAKILNNVTPGIYPDIAFVQGIDENETEVLGNVKVASTPFVGTEVAVLEPTSSEFAPPAVLAETGSNLPPVLALIPAFLLGLTVFAYRRSKRLSQEGGQR